MRNGPYILIVAPEDYPGKKFRDKYAYEHSVVYWRHHNKIATKGYVIHHKNHNKHDNKIENLELVLESKHLAQHAQKPWTYVFANCTLCNCVFRVKGAHYRSRIKVNRGKIYCGRNCQIKSLYKNK